MNKKIIFIFIVLIAVVIVTLIFFRKENNNNENKENNMNNNLNNDTNDIEDEISEIVLIVNNHELLIKLENNSSADALVQKLINDNIEVDAHDYGNFEKVGDLGFQLPTNDERITTKPGDLILYQGNQITLYYDKNTWNFTKLGEVIGDDKNNLKEILGSGNVHMTFKLKEKSN